MRFGQETAGSSQCQFCGAHVSADFRRTLGDEDGVAHRCIACDSTQRLNEGSAAGKEVSYPDPADYPGRNSGARVSARLERGSNQ